MTKSDRQENLSIFSEHSVCSMDGTFKIVPEWYQQMFTIHAAALGVVLQPQTVICDFETALIRTLLATFPGVHIQGCYFHICQAVLRKVTNLGMRNSYINEAVAKKKSKCCWQRLFCRLMMYLLPWNCLAEMLRVQ
ncbi:hypothetical protein T02_4167 [Trichinella nativa]|uniref:MULE transposase domain-containing protein n=1 Tax=Trichinella nativa TaxID=6335 RepID=A0A0V1KS95_9BILA|nr:hypothetical protein T02_4167 [Trichinella nativa]